MLTAFEQISERLDVLRYAASPRGQENIASTGESAKVGLWSKLYGSESHQGAQENYAGHRSNGGGHIVGMAHDFGAGRLGGVALSYSETRLSYQDQLAGNKNAIRSAQLSAYGSKDFGSFYIEGIVAYALQNYNNRRDTILAGYANSNFNGRQWGARLGGGLPIQLSTTLAITPQLRLEWNRIKQDAYQESGNNAFAVSVAGNAVERTRTGIGVQLDQATTIAGINSRPYASLFWHHDFHNSGIDAVASFVDGSSSFITPGQKLGSNTVSLGTGINFFAREKFTASLSYHLSTGRSYSAQTAQATLHWAF